MGDPREIVVSQALVKKNRDYCILMDKLQTMLKHFIEDFDAAEKLINITNPSRAQEPGKKHNDPFKEFFLLRVAAPNMLRVLSANRNELAHILNLLEKGELYVASTNIQRAVLGESGSTQERSTGEDQSKDTSDHTPKE